MNPDIGRSNRRLISLIFIVFAVGVLQDCKKIEPQKLLILHTREVEFTQPDRYTLTGTIINRGEESIIQHGFCWSSQQNPSLADASNQLGEISSDGPFSSTISGLAPNTRFYVRAYATTASLTEYGGERMFATPAATLPVVSTLSASSITEYTANSGGEVSDDGGSPVSARGVCWSTSQNPDINDNKSSDGTGTGSFSSNLIGLNCGTLYYVRAYATNAAGTAYGGQVQFTTSQCPEGLPTVVTFSISNVTRTTASGGGEVTDQGDSQVTARGVCWSTSPNPDIGKELTLDGAGTGSFSSNLTGLNCGTLYYVKAYAINAAGTAYGEQLQFTTDQCQGSPPTVTTDEIVDISPTSATGGGEVTSDGGSTVTERGVCWSTSPTPDIFDFTASGGNGTGTFTCSLTGLDCNTTYYVRAYATNSEGTEYGDQVEFTTSECPIDVPEVNTAAITNIEQTTAISGGNVTNNGGSPVTERGVCWSTSSNPEISDNVTSNGSGTGTFTSNITGLTPNTYYHVRAYATNSAGTGYGEELTFTTLEEATVTDFDGNVYPTVQIGDQVWMAENLRSAHYSDGTPIPRVDDPGDWAALGYSDKAYCWYNNNSSNGETYGGLYRWAAVMNGAASSTSNPSGVQGVCPEGWHVPSESEWQELEVNLGMDPTDASAFGIRGSNQGGMLKEAGFEHWNDPNTAATNETGFTALPGGYRRDIGNFDNLGEGCFYTTATEFDAITIYFRILYYDNSAIGKANFNKMDAFSVRCIKDE